MRFSRNLLLSVQTPCYRTTFVISPQNGFYFRAIFGKKPSPLCVLIIQSAPTFAPNPLFLIKELQRHFHYTCPFAPILPITQYSVHVCRYPIRVPSETGQVKNFHHFKQVLKYYCLLLLAMPSHFAADLDKAVHEQFLTYAVKSQMHYISPLPLTFHTNEKGQSLK